MASASEPLVPAVVPRKNRRGWLIAFGVVEILIGCFFVLTVVLVLLLPTMQKAAAQKQTLPPGLIVMSVVMYGGLAALFFTAGIGSIRCRNWARILMIVMSSFWLFGGIIATLFTFLLMPTVMQQQAPVAEEERTFFLLFMGIFLGGTMVVIPAVFLLFYTRKGVKATCLETRGQPAAEGTGSKAKVPAVVLVLAIWEGLGSLSFLSLFFMRAALVFGVVLHGAAAVVIFIAHSFLHGYAAWAIYQRRLVGWWIALASAVFWGLSAVISFRRDIVGVYREIGLPEQQFELYQKNPHILTFVVGFTLVMILGYIAFILYTRKYFSGEQGSVSHVGLGTGS